MPTSCSRRQSSHFLLTLALTLSLAAGSWPRPQRAADPPAKVPTQTSAETEQRAKEAYGKLGVRFEENRGQSDERVRFISRGGGATVFLANDEATFVLSAREALARRERPKTHTVHMKFEGANPAAEVSGERELEGKFNHFRSSDPSKWQTKVKTYGAVRYRGIYDGVDLVYYGNAQGRMEYDFEVAPGADANQISLKIEGAKAVEVDAAGDLVISTPVGPLKQHKPSVYQEVGGERCAVEGRYAVEAGGRVRFNLGQYDQSAPLVIDPVLSSFFLGDENFGDEPQGIATDSSGNVYITGFILVFDLTGASNTVAFVAKYKPSSGDLIFFTDLFAADKDEPYDIAADSSGNAYVAGYTNDPDGFPVVNPYQSTNAGGNDAFLAKLNLDGSEIIYATYLGGSGDDRGVELAVDSAGQVCVTGSTTSDDFPVANAIQGTRLSSTDYFVTKFNAAGSALIYSTYLDGNKYNVTAIAADPAGNAYLTGATSATDFPVVNAFQSTNAGGRDAFVAKLNAAGSAFIYSSYLGGSGDDSASDIALDSSRRAYVTGETYSTDFPAVNAFQSTNGGGRDAFVARLKADGSALVFSTYLGGSGSDNSIGIGVDSWGHATVGGQTNSTDFPLKSPIPGMDVGIVDAYAARIKANGSALLYSTYVGTENEDTVGGVTADQSGNAYLAANTINENEEEEGDNAFGGDPHDVLLMKLIVTPFIKGRVVTNRAGAVGGVPWVTVKLTGAQTVTKLTDAHGYYSFTGLVQGEDYAVTVSKTNLSFAPQSRTYNNMFSDTREADFTVPSLSVGKVSVKEGNAGEASVTFAVRLQPASPEPVTVTYQTADGTAKPATAGTDYTALPSTTITFDPGQTVKTVSVKVKGDTLDEADETFRLLLSAPTNALISNKEGVCVITDNDPSPSLKVNNVAVTEGDADVSATFNVTLSAASAQTVKVIYRTAFGTATAPADFKSLGLTTLTFAPGETTKTVSVMVRGDTMDEPAETFQLQLSSPVNAIIATAAGTCTIMDDD